MQLVRPAVVRDRIRFRRGASAALRSARPRRTGRGVALFVSMSDAVYQLKLEGVLAKALELDGYRPVVLTPKGARAEAYFHACGIDEFAHPETFLSPRRAREADEAAAEYLAGDVSIGSLKALEFHGAGVGGQALSSLARRLRRGRVPLDEPAVRAALQDELTESMRGVLRGEALVGRLEPQLAVFHEKDGAGVGPICEVALAKGVNVIEFVAAGMHRRDALMLKRYTQKSRRAHPASLSEASWKRVRELPWTERREHELRQEFALRYGGGEKHPDAGLQQGRQIKTPTELRAQLGLDPAHKTAVVFSPLPWDSGHLYGNDLFEDTETWLIETVRAACANAEVDWVIKVHPGNLLHEGRPGEWADEAAIRAAVGELPRHVKVLRPDTDVNTYSFFSVADAGVTIRGTIGCELPCFRIPTLTAGTGRYSGLGFTVDSRSAKEYLGRLAGIQELPRLSEEEAQLAKRYAYALFRLRPFRFSSFHATFKDAAAFRDGDPLAANLELALLSGTEAERAADLHEFAEWAGDRRRLDYLSLEGARPKRPAPRSRLDRAAERR